VCLCARVPAVHNRTGVFVLQHPRERLHPIGTARLAGLGFHKVRIEVAWNAGALEHEPPPWLPDGTALLYPAPGARELGTLPAHERPRNLLVLDGTWHTASTLYRDKRWLQRLPHVRFSPEAPSRYRLRREPEHDYVSTIEAIVEALRVLEPETAGLDAMLTAFDAMIDEQLAHVARREGRPRRRARRPKAQRRLAEALVSGMSRLIVVYVESACPEPNATRELVQVTAQRLVTGALRQWYTRTSFGLPAAGLLAHMRLQASDLDNACELGDFRREWEAYLAQGEQPPIVAAWNQSTFDLLRAAGAALPTRVLLKSAYRGRCGTHFHGLEQVIAGEGLMPIANTARGRAGSRVASAIAVARHLHALQYAPVAPGVAAANVSASTSDDPHAQRAAAPS
jgi:DTW domain-containing protein YfiP